MISGRSLSTQRRSRSCRSPNVWLIYLVISTQVCACATRPAIPVVSESQRDRLGTVGVVQIGDAAKIESNVGPRGSARGLAQGAAAGAGTVTGSAPQVLSSSSCSGNSFVVCIVLLPVLIVGGAVVGGAIGAARAVPVDTVQQIEAQLKLALSEVGEQEALRFQVVKAASRAEIPNVKEITVATSMGDYRQLSKESIDTVLEVGLVEVGLTGSGGKDPLLALHVHAVARLVDVNSNTELYRSTFTHVSASRKRSEWSADQARSLKRGLDEAIAALGTSMVEEIFLMVRNTGG